MKLQFKKKCSLVNGNKLNKDNWKSVYARSTRPCTNVHGVPAIDLKKKNGDQYFETWRLVYEKKESEKDFEAGYIFREINHGCGISGRHKTYRKAIFSALGSANIEIFLDKGELWDEFVNEQEEAFERSEGNFYNEIDNEAANKTA